MQVDAQLEQQLREEMLAAGLEIFSTSGVLGSATAREGTQAGRDQLMVDRLPPFPGGLPAGAAASEGDTALHLAGAWAGPQTGAGAASIGPLQHHMVTGQSDQQEPQLLQHSQQHEQLQAQEQQPQQLGHLYGQQPVSMQPGAGAPFLQQELQQQQQQQQPRQPPPQQPEQYAQPLHEGAQHKQQYQQQYQQQAPPQQQQLQEAQTANSPMPSAGVGTQQATTGSVIAAALQAADAAAASAAQAVPSDQGQQPVQMNIGVGYGAIPGSMPMLQQPQQPQQQQYASGGGQLPLSYMPPGSAGMANIQQQQQPAPGADQQQQQQYLQYQQQQQHNFQSYHQQ
jgi:hypothetical protein